MIVSNISKNIILLIIIKSMCAIASKHNENTFTYLPQGINTFINTETSVCFILLSIEMTI